MSEILISEMKTICSNDANETKRHASSFVVKCGAALRFSWLAESVPKS